MPTTDRSRRPANRSPKRGSGSRRAAEARRAEERKRWVVIGVVVALVAAICLAGWWAASAARDFVSGFGTSQCRAQAGAYTGSLDAEAMNNAALVTAVAIRRGLPPRAATIAIATAMQESKLHNIAHGDRDSVGLFQQRPSQGWGTVEQIMDPIYSTNAFYDRLVKVRGWQTGEITKVAQEVQRSGFPEAYAQHEPEARAIASNLTGETHAGLGCRLPAPETGDHHSGAAGIARDLGTELGVPASARSVSGPTLTLTASSEKSAWSMGAWAVAKADEHGITSVTVGTKEWTRASGTEAWSWHRAPTPVSPTTVVIR